LISDDKRTGSNDYGLFWENHFYCSFGLHSGAGATMKSEGITGYVSYKGL
jgi:hypothetical protein